MTRELTAKELAAVYEGTLVNVEEEDSYGITFSLRKAEIEYREDFSELVFDGEGYEIRFSFFNDSPIECITYDDEEQEAYIEFSGDVAPITIRRADAYMKYLEEEMKEDAPQQE